MKCHFNNKSEESKESRLCSASDFRYNLSVLVCKQVDVQLCGKDNSICENPVHTFAYSSKTFMSGNLYVHQIYRLAYVICNGKLPFQTCFYT